MNRAALVWSAIAEPLDREAAWLATSLGHQDALAWAREARADPVSATMALALDKDRADALLRASQRWAARLDDADPDRMLEAAARVGATALTSDDEGWPRALADWDAKAPHALWVRGRTDLDALWSRSLAIVGARAATAYGEHVAAEIAGAAVDSGLTVLSGGAYGIDAAAHRGALACGGATVAVLAGGVDRLYPAGNSSLLAAVIESGAVVSELPPGYAPHRSRFLSRNRLIGAARATVVVEAAPVSGALNTARHAAELHRPVGAVPGPITAASSRGCNELIRDSLATLLAAPGQAIALALPVGEALEAEAGREAAPAAKGSAGIEFGSMAERAAYDALGPKTRGLDALAATAGLAPAEALTALGGLLARGLARRDGGGWRRIPPRRAENLSDNTGQTR
ncbi:DNA-processing protein DprA [Demequina pelophila]|uniref:DNA-processing protein DprA n=1 Tax=Demequina pelophila TaxID=1638984 RepID=UPI000784ADBC|nr:DNA-processing protein DprA [Demequina pelophila]